jgi:hypothetical protein
MVVWALTQPSWDQAGYFVGQRIRVCLSGGARRPAKRPARQVTVAQTIRLSFESRRALKRHR